MKKIIVLVMISMLFAYLAAAETATSSDEIMGSQVQVIPQKLRFFSSPGETIVENITILNVGAKSADVQVKTSSRLISFSARSISTEPGQMKTLAISIAVPAEGVYHGQLTIGTSSVDIYVVSSGVAPREWNEEDLPPIVYRTDNFAVRDNAGVGLDYARAVGENAQYALNTEIGYGFNPPPDPVIDIVINDLEEYEGAACFGDNLLIEINSRFWNGTYPEWQMGVTLAHEVFHCIQFSYFSPSPLLRRWIDEGAAAWVEDEVYDYANSYLRWVNGLRITPALWTMQVSILDILVLVPNTKPFCTSNSFQSIPAMVERSGGEG